ncbi:MAG TPA: BatD family protein, partial [bacterium]|nr:BatD family protein [bacterium]
MNKFSIVHKFLILFALLAISNSISAQSVTLSTDSSVVSAGEVFRFILTAEGSFDSIIEPDLSNFDVDNRSESQSSSISIINGKMESSKSINYTYFLRAKKAGVFKIGPASVKLKNGRKKDSNIVTVTVTGSSAGSSDQTEGEDSKSGENPEPTANSLLAPLTTWEKRTPNHFIRAVVSPAGEVYEGEPVVVKYYIFTKPNAISDLNFYKTPSFENCWKEEKNESRLSFKRGAIDGNVYDYGLLKT